MSYLKELKIQLETKDQKAIFDFAEATATSCGTAWSKKEKRELDRYKIRDDIILGKAVEVAFKKAGNIFGVELSNPDFNIYEGGGDGGVDFFGIGKNAKDKYLVKGSYDRLYWHGGYQTYSWSVDADNPAITGECNNDYFVLGVWDKYAGDVVIKAVVQAEVLRKADLWKDPKKDGLVGIKKCIYLSDMYKNLTYKQIWGKLINNRGLK